MLKSTQLDNAARPTARLDHASGVAMQGALWGLAHTVMGSMAQRLKVQQAQAALQPLASGCGVLLLGCPLRRIHKSLEG